MQADLETKLRWDRAVKLAADNRNLAYKTSRILHMDIEDARQEIILWIFEALKVYDPTRGASETTYIRNAHIYWLTNKLRKRQIQLVCVDDPAHFQDPDCAPDNVDELTDLAMSIDKANLAENEARAVNILLEREEPRKDITRQGNQYWTKRAIKKIKRRS